jgi:hypothetical protein
LEKKVEDEDNAGESDPAAGGCHYWLNRSITAKRGFAKTSDPPISLDKDGKELMMKRLK